ncbi:MAG: CPBP family glutamic-type intramembrane protease [Pseudomonadota bacterium]
MFRLPGPRDATVTLVGILVFSSVAIPFGVASELFVWLPELDAGKVLRIAILVFFVPAFFEELMFRGPLLWLRSRRQTVPKWALVVSLVAFVAWHPINTVLFMPQAADVFRDWRFLAVAAWLGIVATVLALRTGSIWTAIIFHWLVVVAWKSLLGAPDFF